MTPYIGYNRELKGHPVDPVDYRFQYAWLEGRKVAVLRRLNEVNGGWNDILLWPSGRIFGPNGEYRWRSIGKEKIHGVMILDDGDLPDCFRIQPPLPLDPKTTDHALILWGEWVNPNPAFGENPKAGSIYYANEIPRVQPYPIDGDRNHFETAAKQKKTPRLLVRRYKAITQQETQSTSGSTLRAGGTSAGEFVRCLGFDLRTEIERAEDELHQSL